MSARSRVPVSLLVCADYALFWEIDEIELNENIWFSSVKVEYVILFLAQTLFRFSSKALNLSTIVWFRFSIFSIVAIGFWILQPLNAQPVRFLCGPSPPSFKSTFRQAKHSIPVLLTTTAVIKRHSKLCNFRQRRFFYHIIFYSFFS